MSPRKVTCALGGAWLFRRDQKEQATAAAAASRIVNPKWRTWSQFRSRGQYLGAEPVHRISCAGRIDENPPACLPEFRFGYWVARWTPGADQADALDLTTSPSARRVRTNFTLRPDQTPALHDYYDRRDKSGGLIVLPAGSGKTMIGIHIAAMETTNVLILVPSDALVNQWMERIATFTSGEAVRHSNQKRQHARFTVATLQSLYRLSWAERWEVGARHGMVIVDESHKLPAKTFMDVMASLPCRRRLAFTATPERKDGLGPWVNYVCGPTVHTKTQKDMIDSGSILQPEIQRINTREVPHGDSWNDLISSLCENPTRNQHIRRLAIGRMELGGSVLILTGRTAHCHELASIIPGAQAFTGKLRKKKREALLDDVRQGIVRCVVATTVADEGLDLPRLDTLILAVPSRSNSVTEQRVGRICRPHEGKLPPKVYDLVDDFGPMKGSANSRQRLYRKLGWA